jgi:hypothetical protein
MNSCRAHTVGGGGLYINDLVFVDFDMPIQIPFKNIRSTVSCKQQKINTKKRILKKTANQEIFSLS